jgi:hypothetical protein
MGRRFLIALVMLLWLGCCGLAQAPPKYPNSRLCRLTAA